MSLSVCLLTSDPAGRVATILKPLRKYAEEVVIAADARVDEHTLAGYSALADRLFRIEFCSYERHLDWLYSQCEGDWILRLDGDELLSQAFLRRLPELLDSRTVRQYWILRRWLFGDGERYIAKHPWSVDFVSRLVRNDGTSPSASLITASAQPMAPYKYVTEPFYHLRLLLENERQRRDKVIRYEIVRPGLKAVGGGRLNETFYLPELCESLRLDRVPEEDRTPLAEALNASESIEPLDCGERPRVVSVEQMDRMWEGRIACEGAYKARIESYEPTVFFAASETRTVLFDVTNEGTERWPASLEQTPAIRLGYRWLRADGTLYSETGPRSAFPRAVEPGDRIIAAVHTQAPAKVGDYVLEVDVVHEHVRWFKCEARVASRVRDPRKLSRGVTAIGETPRPTRRRWRRMRIPRTIHRVWLGEQPMPEREVRFGNTFTAHNPSWETRLWTDTDLPILGIDEHEQSRARSPSELSNLVRYEVLSRFGGVYVDTDFECLRALAPILRGIDAFAALESPGRVGTGILGCVPSHPIFARAADLTRQTLGTGTHSADANGPYFLSLVLEQGHNLAIFGAHMFYPYSWEEQVEPDTIFPDAYAVHHWAKSWVEKERAA
jgi:hypothetical protein